MRAKMVCCKWFKGSRVQGSNFQRGIFEEVQGNAIKGAQELFGRWAGGGAFGIARIETGEGLLMGLQLLLETKSIRVNRRKAIIRKTQNCSIVRCGGGLLRLGRPGFTCRVINWGVMVVLKNASVR